MTRLDRVCALSCPQAGGGGLDIAGPILIAVLVGIGLILLVGAAWAITRDDDDNNARSLINSLRPQFEQLVHHPEFNRVANFALKSIAKRW